LDVVDTCLGEIFQALLIERKARGDETHVESSTACGANKFAEIGARERLASGEVRLKHPELGGLAKHARPDVGRQFVVPSRQLKRVRAVHAVERTPVS
jgi:hypothetical protein